MHSRYQEHMQIEIKHRGLILTIVVLFITKNYSKLLPARQLNIMQSVIVANSKWQNSADSG